MTEKTDRPGITRLERRVYFRMTIGAISGSLSLFAVALWRLRALGFLNAEENPYCGPPIMLICLGGALFGMFLGAGVGMFSATRDGPRSHTGSVRAEATKPDSVARRGWRALAISVCIGLAGFLFGYTEGRAQNRRRMVQRDIVYSAFTRVVTLVPVEVMERKHPGSGVAFVSKEIDRALQEPMSFFTESELSRDERKMCESAWELAVKYTGRERVQPGALPVKTLRRVRRTDGATNVLGSTNALVNTSGMDALKTNPEGDSEQQPGADR
jgi:hypothetical protein